MPDILIGNIRGPQGETGPANELLGQSYQFCESDSGTEVPDGPWLDNPPEETHQGMYYWCRNTLTWESGPETEIYAVGYAGRDGEFNGIELVQALETRVKDLETRVTPIKNGGTESTTVEGAQAKLGITKLRTDMEAADKTLQANIDAINDYTTGINLLRGTRDFRQGTTPFKGLFSDGFTFIGNSGAISTYKDDNGFTVIKPIDGSTSLSYFATSAVAGIKSGDVYTLSFDVMFDSSGTVTSSSVLGVISEYSSSSTGVTNANKNLISVTPSYLGITDLSKNTWHSVSITVVIDDNYKDALSHFGAYFYTYRDGAAYQYRKFALNKGRNNHQIWSMAPADIAAEPINDETTGVNLLRGTRDFTLASVTMPNNRDGFYNAGGANYTFSRDEQGFMVATYNGRESSAKYLYLSTVYGLEKETKYTFSFEIKFNEAYSGNIAQIVHRSGANTGKNTYTINTSAIGSTIETGKWYTVTVPITLTAAMADDDYIGGWFYFSTANVSFKKPVLCKGDINNQIYSMAPADIASASLFDSAKPSFLGIIPAENVIQSNHNMNTYSTPGVYVCPTQSIANTLENSPLSGGFRLEVTMMGNNTNFVWQKAIENSDKLTEYVRFSSNGGASWTVWRQTYGNTTVTPYEGGGTNANSLSGAKQNLGITALEARVAALEAKLS